MVTHQLQVERRTGKVRRPETDVLPLSHATNHVTLCILSLIPCSLIKKLICNAEAVVSEAAPRCITDARVAILIQFRIVFYSANE